MPRHTSINDPRVQGAFNELQNLQAPAATSGRDASNILPFLIAATGSAFGGSNVPLQLFLSGQKGSVDTEDELFKARRDLILAKLEGALAVTSEGRKDRESVAKVGASEVRTNISQAQLSGVKAVSKQRVETARIHGLFGEEEANLQNQLLEERLAAESQLTDTRLAQMELSQGRERREGDNAFTIGQDLQTKLKISDVNLQLAEEKLEKARRENAIGNATFNMGVKQIESGDPIAGIQIMTGHIGRLLDKGMTLTEQVQRYADNNPRSLRILAETGDKKEAFQEAASLFEALVPEQFGGEETSPPRKVADLIATEVNNDLHRLPNADTKIFNITDEGEEIFRGTSSSLAYLRKLKAEIPREIFASMIGEPGDEWNKFISELSKRMPDLTRKQITEALLGTVSTPQLRQQFRDIRTGFGQGGP